MTRSGRGAVAPLHAAISARDAPKYTWPTWWALLVAPSISRDPRSKTLAPRSSRPSPSTSPSAKSGPSGSESAWPKTSSRPTETVLSPATRPVWPPPYSSRLLLVPLAPVSKMSSRPSPSTSPAATSERFANDAPPVTITSASAATSPAPVSRDAVVDSPKNRCRRPSAACGISTAKSSTPSPLKSPTPLASYKAAALLSVGRLSDRSGLARVRNRRTTMSSTNQPSNSLATASRVSKSKRIWISCPMNCCRLTLAVRQPLLGDRSVVGFSRLGVKDWKLTPPSVEIRTCALS